MKNLNEEKGISYEVEEAVDFVFNLITNDLKTNKTKSYNSLYLTVKNSFEINLFGESFELVYNFTVTDDIKIYDILKSKSEFNYSFFEAKRNKFFIKNVILINNIKKGNIISNDVIPIDRISHEIKHIYQRIKKDKPLLNYKNHSIYDIANSEKIKFSNSKNQDNYIKYTIAFLIYSLQNAEITATAQSDYSYMDKKINDLNEIENYLYNSSNLKRNILTPINLFYINYDYFLKFEDYIKETYNRNFLWLDKFIKKGKKRTERAIRRILEISKKKFIKEEIYIDSDFIVINDFK